MEGSLRQAGTKLRLSVQLVDTDSGAHLWAENYERAFSAEAAFELQDDLVPRIVSTVADQYGALVHSMSESLRGKSAGEYSPHEATLRAFGYWERSTLEEHAEVREILEAAAARAPGHSGCLAELSVIYWHEYAFGYNVRPDPLGRARAMAQRAIASAPTNHFAHCALATALFSQKDFLAFRTEADRALALNPMDASTAAILGMMIAYAGDWEYGLGIVERAMQLNPHHPGWYHYAPFTDAYRRRDYRGALASALKVNMPGYYWPHAMLAISYGQLGEKERARAALRELHALIPDFGAIAREEFDKWYDAELTEHLLDGLRKAGLEIPEDPAKSRPVTGDHNVGRRPRRRGFLGRGAAVQVQRSRRGAHGPGRGPDGGHRDRPVALLLPPGDCPGLDREVFRRAGGRAGDRQGARRALRDGREPPAGRDEAARRRAARRCDDRRPSLGRELRASLQPGDGFRAAGRARSPDRLDGRRHERDSAAKHGRGRARQGLPRS